MTLKVDLVSPERVLLSVDASMVQCRTIGGGDLAILSGHTPFIGALDVWTVRVRLEGGGEELAAVHGGFVEVSNDHVKILSDLAELANHIDADRARRAMDRAEEALRRDNDTEADAALKRAHARLSAAGQLVS